MKFLNRSCKEVTRLVLEGEDRRLGMAERLAIVWHMRICAACPRFLRQTRGIRHALGRWKNYRDADDQSA